MRNIVFQSSFVLVIHFVTPIYDLISPIRDLIGLTVIINAFGMLLLAVFLVLLALFLWFALNDLVVLLKNYNLRRADRCHWASCGFYDHNEMDPETAECLNPFVSKPSFDKRRSGGNQSGCRRSVQVREIRMDRKPADDYLKELLSLHSAFSKIPWRLVTIGGSIALSALGIIGLPDFIKTFF